MRPPDCVLERIESIEHLRYFPDHVARYAFALQWAPGSRVLDVCCGIGYGTELLARAGASAATGIDISEVAIGKARSRGSGNLSFEIADACAPYRGGPYDLVTCFEGIEHVPDPAALLQQAHDSLSPGGIAVISTPNSDAFPSGCSDNPFHVAEMTERVFRGMASALEWDLEWWAQIGNNRSARPAWQRRLIRSLRLRGIGKQRPPDQPASVERVLPDWPQPANLWAPLPWDAAVDQIYSPPPAVIIAVCHKPKQLTK